MLEKKVWHAPELLSLEARSITAQLDTISNDDNGPNGTVFDDPIQGPGTADAGS